MALNVPMANDVQVNVPSLSDAVGKWTKINAMQQRQELAKNEEARAVDTTERANKMNDLKFGGEQRAAHKEIMTDFKTVLQKKAQMAGVQPNTPEYQQLANATYSTGYDKLMQNTGAPPHDPNTDIDLGAVEALTTAQEAHAMEMEQETAKQNAMFNRQKELAQMNFAHSDQADERNYGQSVDLAGIKHGYDLESAQMENQWKNDAKMDFEQVKQAAAQDKPLPATIVKEQQKLRDQIDTASQMNNMLGTFEKQLEDGKLNLSLTGNLANKARNYAGMANDDSTAFASFQSGMEKMRNDSLRLNSGVQTEGDATRAWNELFANINDEKVVKQRLKEIRGYNESAINFKKADINAMRSEYGKGEFDDSAYTQQSQQTTTPQDIPAGYKMQRNKRTGETRLVKAE